MSNARELVKLTGAGGDYYIDTALVDDKEFTMIVIQSDAVITSIYERETGESGAGTDITASRNYSGNTLPAGYVITARDGYVFNAITLESGDAAGYIYNKGF